MHSDSSKRIFAVFTAVVVAAAFMAALAPAASAEDDTDYDVDLGEFYSYTVQFIFNGSDCSSVLWDFGDGTTSTDWNPEHTYSAIGVYYVTLTGYNDYDPDGDGEGSETSAVYRVEILGYPVISFDSMGGSDVESIQLEAYGVAAEQPDDPEYDGYDFAGWYIDAAYSEEYNWDSLVTKSLTLYARWSLSASVDDSTSGDSDGDGSVSTYTVIFEVKGGSVLIDSIEVEEGSTLTIPGYAGSRSGYTFSGWSIGGVVYSEGDEVAVTSNLTLIAVWDEVTSSDDSDAEGDSSDSSDTGDVTASSASSSDAEEDASLIDTLFDLMDEATSAIGVDIDPAVAWGVLIVVVALVAVALCRRRRRWGRGASS